LILRASDAAPLPRWVVQLNARAISPSLRTFGFNAYVHSRSAFGRATSQTRRPAAPVNVRLKHNGYNSTPYLLGDKGVLDANSIPSD